MPEKWTSELVEKAWLRIEKHIDIDNKTAKDQNRNVGKLKVFEVVVSESQCCTGRCVVHINVAVSHGGSLSLFIG